LHAPPAWSGNILQSIFVENLVCFRPLGDPTSHSMVRSCSSICSANRNNKAPKGN